MQKRNKSRAITLYVDTQYEDTLLFLKYTGGITQWVESQLEQVKIDPDLLASIKRVEFAKSNK